jgi:hypothetical protein
MGGGPYYTLFRGRGGGLNYAQLVDNRFTCTDHDDVLFCAKLV